ncbi:aspartate carbamoyltransferase [Halobacteroides halobius DSM 5150]|uniref:Aspartate carbamoyltransferase n=1 Tax=Halobacteroides halobius (strain ATCC 35273 / DSM 5150 / MD-1) TaxID=748449 RepID=L0K950_HALHC|nr:aspartate carbamoyltransferase catalytic subunit [Halobacteroides halobius]AGB40874.1 aspartate carbamoyltransferase [Halobacteroides halobius DSM 5150]
MGLIKKDLLGLQDLTKEEIELILETAQSMTEVLNRSIKKVPTLRGKLVVNLFYEPSTRTKSSFGLAAKRLSADGMNLSIKQSSVVKGESLVDTAKTLRALGADGVVIRHGVPGAAKLLAETVEIPVLNAGDGMHEHPTQALLDLYTIQKKREEIADKKVAIIGDIKHSRVARSNIWGLNKLGAEVRLVGPTTLMPANIEQMGAKVYTSLEEGIKDVDVIYLLRIQQERQDKGFFPTIKEYTRFYGLRKEALKLATKDALIMHPGPINRGIEISRELAYSNQSVIEDQVSNGVAIRMALLYLLIEGGLEDE